MTPFFLSVIHLKNYNQMHLFTIADAFPTPAFLEGIYQQFTQLMVGITIVYGKSSMVIELFAKGRPQAI